MRGVALKMLFGDPAKYLGLVFGVAFTTLLITQQGAMFVGLMARTGSVISDVTQADIWVSDTLAIDIDMTRPMRDTAVARVRGVPGVAWAVPLYKAQASLKTSTGRIDNGLLLGVDDVTLIGAPQSFLLGSLEDLRRPDAIAVDGLGYGKLWPGQPLTLGRTLELNDRRAVVVAISNASAAFTASVVIHARYSQAVDFVPQGRNQLSFVLARAKPGEDPAVVARHIETATGLQAHSADAFFWQTVTYFLVNTGIPISFGVVILLGVIVGVVIVGLTFNMFVSDNLRQYGALKALGMTDARLVGMVLLQAGVVGAMGYAIGTGAAAAFFWYATKGELQGFILPWWIAAGVAVLTAAIILAAIGVSLRRVLVLDPAIVFRG